VGAVGVEPTTDRV